ncbi:MAG: NlpBDapX lipoprotein [Gallionellales bacterium GWA2_60_142]|jgi:outer membrane protein assembly factor BamC|nr:MAG: NlpBDapX lipoprotein [Gallionellales bacterium GWA2_60_142]HCI14865.1 NlpBDapX lipoprotein [Gallionellaceae bacterium]
MKALHIGISTVVLLSLAGCGAMGLGSKRIDYHAGAVQAPSLEVPPGLTSPGSDDRYKVPGGEAVATYSDYSKGGEAAQGSRAAAVLPEVKGVRLERNGAQRWLVVSDKAENVWPVVKAFWQENGLSIASEDQAAGVMETDWAENRAKIPLSGVRSVIGKVFDNLYSSGEKDQYRTRLERGKDGASTEVYITHRGMEEVVAADGNTSKWQPRANDPEIEAILLQKLLVRFGASEAEAANAVPANAPAGAAASVGGDGKANLRETFDGSKVIVVNDAFDRAWRRVGLAIEGAGLAVEDKDRAKGVYFLRLSKAEKGWMDTLMFWQDDEAAGRRYRVNVKDGGASSEVTVTDQEGVSDDATAALIEAIYKNIGQ